MGWEAIPYIRTYYVDGVNYCGGENWQRTTEGMMDHGDMGDHGTTMGDHGDMGGHGDMGDHNQLQPHSDPQPQTNPQPWETICLTMEICPIMVICLTMETCPTMARDHKDLINRHHFNQYWQT